MRPLGSLVFQLFTSDIRFHCCWFAAASLEQQLQRSFSAPTSSPSLFSSSSPSSYLLHLLLVFLTFILAIYLTLQRPPSRHMLLSCLHTFVGASSKTSPILRSLQLIFIRSFRLRLHLTQYPPTFTFPCTILSLKSTRTLILKPCPPSSLKRATLD